MGRRAIGGLVLALGVASWGIGAAPSRAAPGVTPRPEDDPFGVEHRQAVAANPPDLVLTLGLEAGTNRFRQGEIVRLALGFSSTSPQRYRLDAAGYDRGGRLHVDELHLAPVAGTEDPIWEYFARGGGWIGGGIRSMPTLGEATVTLTIELNEWVRFDRPGTYRLYVTSHRVEDLRSTSPAGYPGLPTAVSSSVVEFTIVEADDRWSESALAGAIRAMDESPGGDARRAACRTLRFLASPAAAREMARRYEPGDRECGSQLMFGLIGSPAREAAIQAMSERVEAPQGEVDPPFLDTLALLVFDHAGIPRHAPEILGLRPGGSRSPEERQGEEARIRMILRRYAGRLLAALPRKTGRARAVSALTLLELTEPASCGAQGEPPAVAPQLADGLREELAASFSELPAAKQEELLSLRWDMLRGPGMAAVLRHTYAEPPALPWFGGESLPTLALRRLYELAPAEATELLLAEAGRPAPRVGPKALGLLPEEAASKLELQIVEHLEAVPPTMAGMEELSFLVARYATRAVLPRVQAYYENQLNEWMCWQAAFIAYFLRVEPALGEAKLREVLDRPPKPGHPDCATGLLGAVRKLFYSPVLDSVAEPTPP